MTSDKNRDRRQILALLATSAIGTALQSAAAGPLDQGIGGTGAAPPTDRSDRGIGGTGVVSPADPSDRGIGGTGVIGTIRMFGSIYVNDLRISYPPDVAVRIDGRSARVTDLKIGQVVRVATAGNEGALSTRIIDVTSEVVGRVEQVGAGQITVLGQTVVTAGLGDQTYRVGDTVAVGGLRRNDGTIVASLVEPRPGAVSRVAGPVRLAADGSLTIGGLQLTGLDPSLNGQRALVIGRMEGDRLAVTHAVTTTSLLPNVRTLSVESYVERRGDRLALGSGLAVENGGHLDIPVGTSIRAVLTTTVGAGGRLSVDSLRANGRTYGAAPGSHGSPGRGGRNSPPTGRGVHPPANFEHGNGPNQGGFDKPDGRFGRRGNSRGFGRPGRPFGFGGGRPRGRR